MNDVNATLSEQEQVRRAKLQKLVDEGKEIGRASCRERVC